MPRRLLVVALALTAVAACSTTPPVTDAGPTVPTVGVAGEGTSVPAPGTAPGTTSPATPPGTAPAGTIAWSPCPPRGYECGTLTVPLDYSDPGGATIDLAVKRRPASAAGRRIGSVIVNPGGPGGSGVDALPSIAKGLGSEVGERFDVVSWDPRGVGRSAPLSCDDAAIEFYEQDLTTPRLDDAAAAEARDWAAACERTDARMLPFVGTSDVARDLDRLRAAVGDQEITYAGFSYGTLIGLVYSELFPERIRAMVLDGVVDPTLDTATSVRTQAAAVEGSLDRFFSWCRATPTCAIRDDPEGKTRAVLDQAHRSPLRATIAGATRSISPTLATIAVVTATYDSSSWPTLASAIDAALDGNGAALAGLANAYLSSASSAANLAVGCLDSATPTGAAYDELVDASVAAAPDVGAVTANLGRPCEHWPVPPKPLPTEYDGRGAPPMLVWGTTGDNATPYDNAVRVAAMLEGARLATLDADRHTALGHNQCVTEITTAYLVDLTLPPEGARC